MAENPPDNTKAFLEDAVERFVDARLQGTEPDIDEFVKTCPGFENQIRKRIQSCKKSTRYFHHS